MEELVAQEWINGAKAATLGPEGVRARPGRGGTTTLRAALRQAFLPAGYPDSVTPDYLGFQLWDTLQALSSYIRGMLSSQAILVGVGVGEAGATALGAVFQFFLRDLAGMLGGILFATWQGVGLDSYAKQWRIFADCLNDLGMAVELASPLFPRAFLALACLGSVARAVTGVAGGATRAALTLHFARARNAADIAAKEGSQETATTMLGMVVGMGLTRLAAGSQLTAWAAFLALTWLHIYANVWALRQLQMTSLNRPRLDLLLAHYWERGAVLAPAAIAAQESLLAPPLRRLGQLLGGGRRDPEIAVAPPLASLGPAAQRELAAVLAQPAVQGLDQRYLVVLRRRAGGTSSSRQGTSDSGSEAPGGSRPADALVLLRPGATPQDVLRGYCVARLEAKQQQGGGAGRGGSKERAAAVSAAGGGSGGWRAAQLPRPDLERLERLREGLAAAGWACDRVALLQGESRLGWGPDCHAE